MILIRMSMDNKRQFSTNQSLELPVAQLGIIQSQLYSTILSGLFQVNFSQNCTLII